MIGHRITLAQLSARITANSPNWFSDAADILNGLPTAPASSDFDALWTKVKVVYIRLQHSKCCFCEKSLEGKIEQDVEHFRPKAKIKPWKVTRRLAAKGVVPAYNPAEEPGYHRLAYHPFNYAMSCKFCNSVSKKNFFPIAGARNSAGTDPQQLNTEQAYLIYPIGNFDGDPEHLITFDGLSPTSAAPAGFDAHRAWVTIELFRLGSITKRPILYTTRARLLRHLYLELRGRDIGATQAERDGHQRAVDNLTSDRCPFANCMRSFQRLYANNRVKADAYAEGCLKYLEPKGLAV